MVRIAAVGATSGDLPAFSPDFAKAPHDGRQIAVFSIMNSDVRCLRRRSVLPESVALAAICTADMVSTLYWVRTHVATESNPLMAIPLAHSDAAFLLVKGASYVLPIVILEGLRAVRPEFVRRALRACVAGYVAIYVLGSIGLLLAR